MQETRISLETSKLAVEKGFDELCNVYYDRDNEDCSKYASPAPTQSLLQKWLREKHGIDVIPMTNFYKGQQKDGYLYSIDKFVDNIHDGQSYDSDQLEMLGEHLLFNTYEEALEAGLFKALKLINNE